MLIIAPLFLKVSFLKVRAGCVSPGARPIFLGVLTEAWAQTARPTVSRRAFAFWYARQRGDRQLPDQLHEGLASAVRRAGLEVTLLAYQPLTNVPAGVVVGAAEEMFPRADFEKGLKRTTPPNFLSKKNVATIKNTREVPAQLF